MTGEGQVLRRFCSIEEFEAEGSPGPAEQALIDASRAGEGCTIGDGTRPTEPTEANTIRAELLRLVITGGTPGCGLPEAGVYLEGAWIAGKLDLSFATARGMTTLTNCTFPEEIVLLQARLNRLSLYGSLLAKGMNAAGMTVTQAVLLRSQFLSQGPVVLTAATIGGQLDCTGATFDLQGQDPAKKEHYALADDSMRVANTLFFKEVILRRGIVHLGFAQVGGLNDDAASWRQADDEPRVGPALDTPRPNLCLDGFTYGHLWGEADADQRREWLLRGTMWRDRFRPQPYQQLAQVLRRQGHDREARQIMVEMERRIAIYRQEADRLRGGALWSGDAGTRGDLGRHWIGWRGAQAWDWLFRSVTGYGYMPHRALGWMLALLVLGTLAHALAYRAGVMVPASAAILTSADWAAAMQAAPGNPVSAWNGAPAARHYATFSAFAYTLDLSLPILDLGQEAAWGASTATGFGAVVWVLGGAIKLTGWLVSGLGLAAAAGIVRRERG